MSYPSLLTAGVTAEGTYSPTELFSGEADITTDRGTVGAAAIAQFVIVARDETGLIVAWNPLTGAASKAGTFSGTGTANDTITVNGQAFTLKASAAAAYEVTIGATAADTATNFAAAINAYPDETNCRATVSGAVVTLYALFPGAGGNSIAISESGTGFSFAGGATALSGGADETEAKAIGIAAQAGAISGDIPFFTSGCFNHAALTWPASIDTLAKRKAVFDRTPIRIEKVIGVTTPMTYP